MAPGKQSSSTTNPKTPKVARKHRSTKVTPSPKTAPTKQKKKSSACDCNWDDCPELMKIFTRDKHPDFAGRCIDINLSDTVNAMNFIKCAYKNLGIPASEYKDLKQKAADDSTARRTRATHSAGGTKKKERLFIAKHHFKPGLWKMKKEQTKKWSWFEPMSKESVKKYGALADNFMTDKVVRYDSSISNKGGNGRDKKESATKDEIKYIKAPCAAKEDVWKIAKPPPTRALDSNTLDKKREAAVPVEELRATIESKDAMIEALQKQLAESNADNKKKDAKLKEMKTKLQSSQRQQKRQRLSNEYQTGRHSKELANVEVEVQESAILQEAREIITAAGGLSRLTLFSDEFHKKNTLAAKILFGYRSWGETKQYLYDHFPGEIEANFNMDNIIFTRKKRKTKKKSNRFKMPNLHNFEKALICRMFLHRISDQQMIALMLARHRTTISRILYEWGPRWGEVGEDLCNLDITEEYLKVELPNKLVENGYPHVVMVDGKDVTIGTKANDGTASRVTFSSKTDCDAARCLTYSTASGLVFEHTPLFGGRASETKLQRLWGSLGRERAPVEEWKNIANQPGISSIPPNEARHYNALNNILKYEDFEKLLDEVCNELLGDEGAPHDDVLITGNATGLDRLGLLKTLECDKNEEENDVEEATKEEESTTLMTDAIDWFKQHKAMKMAEEKEKEKGGKKRAPLLSPERLREQNEAVLRTGANENGLRKLRQLERHERLHRSYEDKKLRKCLLSYFLLAVKEDRHKLLRWMGSKMIDHDKVPMPNVDELPKIWLRLAKIPALYMILADKGFADTERDYPNFNQVETPTKLAAGKGYRKSQEHIKRDRPLTSSRFSAETVFSRVYSEDILNGKIPYYLIPLLPYAHSLAHGEANLCQPFRRPGDNSLVSDEYWP